MSDVWVWSSLFDLESIIKQVFLSISCYRKYRFERSMNEVQTNIRSSSCLFRDSFFVIISHDWACKVLLEDLSKCFQQSAGAASNVSEISPDPLRLLHSSI